MGDAEKATKGWRDGSQAPVPRAGFRVNTKAPLLDLSKYRRCQHPPAWIQEPPKAAEIDGGVPLREFGSLGHLTSTVKDSCHPLCDYLCGVTQQSWVCSRQTRKEIEVEGWRLEVEVDRANHPARRHFVNLWCDPPKGFEDLHELLPELNY